MLLFIQFCSHGFLPSNRFEFWTNLLTARSISTFPKFGVSLLNNNPRTKSTPTPSEPTTPIIVKAKLTWANRSMADSAFHIILRYCNLFNKEKFFNFIYFLAFLLSHQKLNYNLPFNSRGFRPPTTTNNYLILGGFRPPTTNDYLQKQKWKNKCTMQSTILTRHSPKPQTIYKLHPIYRENKYTI